MAELGWGRWEQRRDRRGRATGSPLGSAGEGSGSGEMPGGAQGSGVHTCGFRLPGCSSIQP